MAHANTPFQQLTYEEKRTFVLKYRERREHDLTAVCAFNLTKEAKVRTPGVKKEKKIAVTSTNLALLKKMGLI